MDIHIYECVLYIPVHIFVSAHTHTTLWCHLKPCCSGVDSSFSNIAPASMIETYHLFASKLPNRGVAIPFKLIAALAPHLKS